MPAIVGAAPLQLSSVALGARYAGAASQKKSAAGCTMYYHAMLHMRATPGLCANRDARPNTTQSPLLITLLGALAKQRPNWRSAAPHCESRGRNREAAELAFFLNINLARHVAGADLATLLSLVLPVKPSRYRSSRPGVDAILTAAPTKLQDDLVLVDGTEPESKWVNVKRRNRES